MRFRRRALVIWALAAVLAAGCARSPAKPASQPPQVTEQPQSGAQPAPALKPAPVKGAPAPIIRGENVFNGQRLQLSDFRGKAVLVNFWATWCPPCREEMPALQALRDEMGDKLQIIAVGGDPSEGSDKLASFARDRQLTFQILWDRGAAMETYKVLALPTTYLIDQNGIIREKIQGAMSLEMMREVVKQTLEAGSKQQ